MKRLALPILLLPVLLVMIQSAHASYVVTSINTTVVLNQSTSAQVTDIIEVSVSNLSVNQYTQDRLALNFTLSQWQQLVGPELVQHIISPRGGIYNFKFLPGPLINSNDGKIAYLLLSYAVTNVTIVNQTGPRTFLYKFNNNVFNFQHAESGPVLGENTTLNIILPAGSKIDSIFPIPDSPALSFTQDYKNVTELSWYSDEPLSKFTLTYTLQQSLQAEVISFFTSAYNYLGGFAYVLIAAAIALFIIYTYLRVGKQ